MTRLKIPSWRTFWGKIKREKRRFFSSSPTTVNVQYDPSSYSHNFDDGSSTDPDNLSRSFSARFAVPSKIFYKNEMMCNDILKLKKMIIDRTYLTLNGNCMQIQFPFFALLMFTPQLKRVCDDYTSTNKRVCDRNPTNKVKNNWHDIGGPMTRPKTQIMKQSLSGLRLELRKESETVPKWVAVRVALLITLVLPAGRD
ncbi:hypothetical protein CR513_54104, partial [Mucuna pruriens]